MVKSNVVRSKKDNGQLLNKAGVAMYVNETEKRKGDKE